MVVNSCVTGVGGPLPFLVTVLEAALAPHSESRCCEVAAVLHRQQPHPPRVCLSPAAAFPLALGLISWRLVRNVLLRLGALDQQAGPPCPLRTVMFAQ